MQSNRNSEDRFLGEVDKRKVPIPAIKTEIKTPDPMGAIAPMGSGVYGPIFTVRGKWYPRARSW